MIYWQVISFDWAGGCGKVWGQVVGQGMAARNLRKQGQITRSWHKRHHETIWKNAWAQNGVRFILFIVSMVLLLLFMEFLFGVLASDIL